MVDTWVAPDLRTRYVRLDESGEVLCICRYVDLLAAVDDELWPDDAESYDLLLFSFNAHELTE